MLKLDVYREIGRESGYLLKVMGNVEQFPVVVGFSRKTAQGEIIDEPARWLLMPSDVWWIMDEQTEIQHNQEIIFKIYRDDSFSDCLFSTGWCIPDTNPRLNKCRLGELISKSTTGKRWREEWREFDNNRMNEFKRLPVEALGGLAK